MPTTEAEEYLKRAEPSAPQHNALYAAMIERLDVSVARMRETLEHAAATDGVVRPGDGVATQRIDSTTHLIPDPKITYTVKAGREDFEKGHQGFRKLEDVFARYAAQLSDEPAVQEQLKARKLTPEFLDYDWSLNDVAR